MKHAKKTNNSDNNSKNTTMAAWHGWVAASDKDEATQTLEKRLWDAADQFRANSGLNSQEYSTPVLGLIFLRFADARFAAQRAKLEKDGASARRGRRVYEPDACIAKGILYLSREARESNKPVRDYLSSAFDKWLSNELNENKKKRETPSDYMVGMEKI
jgi:type I restriction-modification system DNA methylase subunit